MIENVTTVVNKKKIVNWLIATSMAVAVVGIGVSASHRAADSVCGSIMIVIVDSLQRQYVTTAELQQQLHQAGLWQIGEPLSKISCHAIEQNLLTHPMLRNVDCYELHRGELRIAVRQRQPIMLVMGDEHYYIDSDRKMMPVRASVNTPVPVISGRIGKQQAQGEMFDFVMWLSRETYWREKIHHIHLITPKMIEMKDDEHGYTLIVGPLDNVVQRLEDLKQLYEKGFANIGYPQYKQIDLQYTNQIIGRK